MPCLTPSCVIGKIIDGGDKAILSDIAGTLGTAVSDMVVPVWTMWVSLPTANLTGGGPSSASEPVAHHTGIETVLGYVTWIGFGLAILSLLILAGSIAVHLRRGEGLAAVGRLGVVLVGVVLISTATAVVTKIIPTVSTNADGSPSAGGATAFLQSALLWYTAAGATFSVIIAGIRMAWERRAQAGLDVIKSLLTLIVVSAAGVAITWTLVKAADEFAVWIMQASLSCTVTEQTCFGTNYLAMMSAAKVTSPGLSILINLIGLIGAIVQIVLLFVRSGMLVILSGVLPVAASATNTEMGKSWLKKCTSWLTAFLLYKPAAAIVYAAAFQLSGSGAFGADGLLQSLAGCTMLLLAVFTLPALMKLVTPAIGAMAGAAASGAHIASTGLSAVPTGAMQGVGGGKPGPSAPVAGTPTGNTSTATSHVTNAQSVDQSARVDSTANSYNSAGSEASRGRRYASSEGPASSSQTGANQAAQQGGQIASNASAASTSAAGTAGSAGLAGAASAAAGPVGLAVMAATQVAHAGTAAVKKFGEDATGASND